MPIETSSPLQSLAPIGWRRPFWFALLVAASVAFSLGFACATPLAAFAAAAALTLPRRDALLLTAAAWLANQLVGFAFLAYPMSASTFAWGVAIGVAALLAAEAARWAAARGARGGTAVAFSGALLAAYAVYEAVLLVVAVAALGGVEDFTPAIVGRIFLINAGAYVGLLALNWLGAALGFAGKPAFPLSAAERRA